MMMKLLKKFRGISKLHYRRISTDALGELTHLKYLQINEPNQFLYFSYQQVDFKVRLWHTKRKDHCNEVCLKQRYIPIALIGGLHMIKGLHIGSEDF